MSDNPYDPSRREFIKIAGMAATYTGGGSFLFQGCKNEPILEPDPTLFDIFKNPNAEAKPFFRWWWNGNNVSKEEISRELKLIKESGAGGVEINPIAMPEEVEDPGNGLIWLSNEWCEALAHSVEKARELGLVTDLIVGTGWPFGGEFIKHEETLQGLTFETLDFTGPGKNSVKIELPEDEHEKILKIILVPKILEDLDDSLDLTDTINQKGILEFEIKEGVHSLMIVRWRNKFRTVMFGSPGGSGAVLDHFNQQAVRKYLDNMSDKLLSYFDNNLESGLRSLFCDSIELEGANWTDDMIEIFKNRRGYDIEDFLPYIHISPDNTGVDIQNTLRRVRYDFSLTLAELLMERFIKVYHEWCKENKVLSRYQAYGHPWLYTDMIDGFMVPDIPEGDQWLYNAGWSLAGIDEIRYGIWNKYASSGGNLAGRKIISSEAMTNLRGVFRASLEYIKQATDLNFVAGINHLVLHGYNYFPEETEFPGWIRFGTYFNEHNTWWQFFPLWASYTSRLSAVFQHSKAVSQVAILGPTADVWSESGLDRNPFNMTPWYLHSIWQALNHNGICSDYVNSYIINSSTMTNGKMTFGDMSYSTLLICNIKTIDPATLNKILEYRENGLNIVIIGEIPSLSPGYKDYIERDKEVKHLSKRILQSGANFIEDPDQESTDPHQGLSDWTRGIIDRFNIEKSISIKPNDASLFFNHRKYLDTDMFFVVNTDLERTISTVINVNIKGKKIWRWCPESLQREIVSENSGGDLELKLSPLESGLLVIDRGSTPDILQNHEDIKQAEFELKGKWKVECRHHINHSEFKTELQDLADLSELEELSDFSGRITYTLKFDLQEKTYTSIDPGSVYDIAEISINGVDIGTRWWGKLPLIIPENLLKNEGNTLVINVHNRLYNYCASLTENPVAKRWIDMNRYKTKLPAGLLGPVRLS